LVLDLNLERRILIHSGKIDQHSPWHTKILIGSKQEELYRQGMEL
jgi:hypothetical protein